MQTKHTLSEISSMIDEGTAFMGQLVASKGQTLVFSVNGNDIIERICLDWVPQTEIDKIPLDIRYYVVEEFEDEDPVYTICLYDLTGRKVKEFQQKIT